MRTVWKNLLSSPAGLFFSLQDVRYRSLETLTRTYWAAWRNLPQISILPKKPVHNILTYAFQVYLPLYGIFHVVSWLPIFQPKLCILYCCLHIYVCYFHHPFHASLFGHPYYIWWGVYISKFLGTLT
jgi:hypothetical protein